MNRVTTAALAILLTTSTPSLAARGVPWNSLDRDEQTLLQKHRQNWDSLDSGEQTRMVRGARKFLALPEEKRKAVKEQREQYQQMSPQERNRLRDRYREQYQRR